MPSLPTYFIIVLAILAAGVALWLLAHEDKPKLGKRVAPKSATPVAEIAAEPESAAIAEPEPVAAPEPEASRPEAAKLRATAKPRASKAKAGPADALTTMKGLGPKAAARLNELGVTRFEQIAAWTDEDVARIAPQLGNFRDRVVRDRWVEQAAHLASGDTAGFEAKFGKLG